MIRGLRSIAADHLANLKNYPRKIDWVLSLYQQALFRGRRLPGRDAVVTVQVTGEAEPLYLRLGGSDWLVLEQVFHRCEYAPVVAALPRADTIIDLGANIGFTVRYWRRHYPTARIVAVEPDAENVGMLRRNSAGAGKRLTEIVEAGIVDVSRPISLQREGGSWNYRIAPAFDRANAIAAVTMDELMAGFGVSGVDLLKCDIEGAEREVFEDSASWIGQVRTIAVEVHAPLRVHEFMSLVARAGGDFELLTAVDTGANPLCILRNRVIGEARTW